ncbi:hypothetical protein [Sphingomonas sp. SUN039]|uniref:hypothetical protein n=1 Tax=Sphingomonas sp. SUN039 TaxID=2937787 RepID=UPI0021646B46|nr:hypothetical protein [Sphingomonas sp. SUN039]UVO53557.1 hypothetical protein M0209_05275 [Sphingomonas sp. SUN039]
MVSRAARLFGAAALMIAAIPVQAQQPAPATPPPASPPAISAVPIPGELEIVKLVWTTMAAVDHANQSGNYSVLRDLASPSFQIANDPAKLTQIFASLRASGTDLSNTLLLAPTYRSVPKLVQPGVLYVQGYFGLRPTAITFELYYQWVQGKWRLLGVSIVPSTMGNEQPVAGVRK